MVEPSIENPAAFAEKMESDVVGHSSMNNSANYHLLNSTENDWTDRTNISLFMNGTSGNSTLSSEEDLKLNELQLIKAIVLVVVITILLVSTGRVVLKTFSKYTGTKRDDMI